MVRLIVGLLESFDWPSCLSILPPSPDSVPFDYYHLFKKLRKALGGGEHHECDDDDDYVKLAMSNWGSDVKRNSSRRRNTHSWCVDTKSVLNGTATTSKSGGIYNM